MGEVVLRESLTAMQVLHGVLCSSVAAFPGTFANRLGDVSIPQDIESLRSRYQDILPAFECARLASAERYAIGAHLLQGARDAIIWKDGDRTLPLHEVLAQQTHAPLALTAHTFAGGPGWTPNIVYNGHRWEVSDLTRLAHTLLTRGVISEAAACSIQNALSASGQVNLSGHKIAVLGAGAEMAPTRFWLTAGADVLWLDTVPPPSDWLSNSELAGRLYWCGDNIDLLRQPAEVLATIVAFAGGDPIHLGLYAYAPGKAREMRLTASMNAIVDALPNELIGSVTLLVSPTTPTALDAHDLASLRDRVRTRPMWETALARCGLLGRGGGCVEHANAAVTRTVVTIQGASYQAAQYLGKVLVAEQWAHSGQLGGAVSAPLRVSANTAAITRTRSLDHPVFAAAFGGAAALGVETLTPRQSRQLNGLLSVHDWFAEQPPVPGKVRVHGGIHTLPYPLNAALRVAAAIGFARSPRLLAGLFKR